MSWKLEIAAFSTGALLIAAFAATAGRIHSRQMDDARVRLSQVEIELASRYKGFEDIRVRLKRLALPCGNGLVEAEHTLREDVPRLKDLLLRKAPPDELRPVLDRVHHASYLMAEFRRYSEEQDRSGISLETINEDINRLKQRIATLEYERDTLHRRLAAGGRPR